MDDNILMDGEHENQTSAEMVVDRMVKKLPLILSIQSLLNQFYHLGRKSVGRSRRRRIY